MDNRKSIIKCLENILIKSSEARKWYLKTDLKVRFKLFASEENSVQDLINIWKRIKIIKSDFESSQDIINEAVLELAEELKSNNQWTRDADSQLNRILANLTDDSVQII